MKKGVIVLVVGVTFVLAAWYSVIYLEWPIIDPSCSDTTKVPHGPATFAFGSHVFTRKKLDTPAKACHAKADDNHLSYTASRIYPTLEETKGAWVLIVLKETKIAQQEYLHLWKTASLDKLFHPNNRKLFLVLVIQDHGYTEEEIPTLLNPIGITPYHGNSQPPSQPGLRTYSFGYQLSNGEVQPVFVVLWYIPLPYWMQRENVNHLEFKTETCQQRDYAYVEGNHFYYTHMPSLQLLDYFDFFFKLDMDVVITQPVPDLFDLMVQSQAIFMHTMASGDPGECTRGLNTLTKFYLELQSAKCERTLIAKAHGNPIYENEGSTYYGNFIAGWLGLTDAPEVVEYSQIARAWLDKWKHRWGDQQYWTRMVGLYAGYDRVLDLSRLRHQVFEHNG